MNLEALSLVHYINVCIDVLARRVVLGPLDMELNVGMESLGILVLLYFSVHASLIMTA